MESESLPIPLIIEEKVADRSRFSLKSSALSSLPSGSQFLHIISITGSQSSGKSTLVNHAFSLNFSTMAPNNTGQTTRGIDLQFTNRYICLDMEGSDSAERHAEDNAYIERMIGAFGLVVSNLLIYNINIQDVRANRVVDCLANMMAHYLRICNEKRIILFCIRDVVEGSHVLEDLRTKISQNFKDAWNQAIVSLREENNNHTLTDDLESVFEMDLITCSKYEEAEGRFVNEEVVMSIFRDKVERILQDLNQIEVRSLKSLWSETWSNIDRKEMIEFGKLVVNQAWEVMRQKLIEKWYSLVSEIHYSGDYVDKLNEYETEFSYEIHVNYANDEFAKQALLTLCRQEFAKQAVYLEVERFKISIKNYFYSESEHTNTLYADLISIYQQIDRDDSDRNRIHKSAYKKFLHESATEQNLYLETIKISLNSIYSISQERINKYLAKLNEADITEINLRIDLSNLDKVFHVLFSGIGFVLATIGVSLIAEAAAAIAATATATTTATAATAATAGAGMATGGILLGVGVFVGAVTVGVMAAWKRGTIWREMAKEAQIKIIEDDSFEKTYKGCKDMLRISNLPSS